MLDGVGCPSLFPPLPLRAALNRELTRGPLVFTELQLEHLPERFGSRVLNLAEVPAAFVRPREDGQAVIAEADDDADADEDAVGGAGGDAEDPDAL